jgi:hypothetical protein
MVEFLWQERGLNPNSLYLSHTLSHSPLFRSYLAVYTLADMGREI